MAIHLLNAKSVANAKPQEKDKRLSDGGGLYLLNKKNGAKWWRFDYSIDGDRKTLSLGVYPVTGLADARRRAEEARKQISKGIDPSTVRKKEKERKQQTADNKNRLNAGLPILNSFEDITKKCLASVVHELNEETHRKKIRRFELHTFPVIGPLAINEIKSPDVFNVVKPLIARSKLETAHRIHSEISVVFSYAIAHGYTDYDPAQAVARQIPSQKVQHRAALTEPKEVAQLLRDISSYEGTFIVQSAFRITPLIFQRPGEIRQMMWEDIYFEEKEWRYFVTKTKTQHIVPLSTQALSIIEEIKPLTGSGKYVFPSSRDDGRPMSENTIRTALRTLGYAGDVMTAHGFRTTASTLLNEQGWSPDAIERQLCHMPKDAVRAAYNRAQYLEERRKMMQSWADYLDKLKKGADVIQIRKHG